MMYYFQLFVIYFVCGLMCFSYYEVRELCRNSLMHSTL
jgi:hypothetical protein